MNRKEAIRADPRQPTAGGYLDGQFLYPDEGKRTGSELRPEGLSRGDKSRQEKLWRRVSSWNKGDEL